MILPQLARRVGGSRIRFRRFQSTLPELPPLSEWSKLFPSTVQTRDRVSFYNPKTAEALVKAFGIGANPDSPPHVIIEAYPGIPPKKCLDNKHSNALQGPGLLTRTMLQLPPERVKKIIVLEDNKYFLPYLLVGHHSDLFAMFAQVRENRNWRQPTRGSQYSSNPDTNGTHIRRLRIPDCWRTLNTTIGTKEVCMPSLSVFSEAELIRQTTLSCALCLAFLTMEQGSSFYRNLFVLSPNGNGSLNTAKYLFT